MVYCSRLVLDIAARAVASQERESEMHSQTNSRLGSTPRMRRILGMEVGGRELVRNRASFDVRSIVKRACARAAITMQFEFTRAGRDVVVQRIA